MYLDACSGAIEEESARGARASLGPTNLVSGGRDAKTPVKVVAAQAHRQSTPPKRIAVAAATAATGSGKKRRLHEADTPTSAPSKRFKDIAAAVAAAAAIDSPSNKPTKPTAPSAHSAHIVDKIKRKVMDKNGTASIKIDVTEAGKAKIMDTLRVAGKGSDVRATLYAVSPCRSICDIDRDGESV